MEFNTDFKVTGDILTLEYQFKNTSPNKVFVFNRLYREEASGKRTIDPDLTFIHLDSNKLLVIEKIIPKIPNNMDVESPIIPYAKCLEARSSLSEKIHFSIPIKQNIPYLYEKALNNSMLLISEGIQFNIAFLEEKAEAFNVKKIVDAGKTVYSFRTGKEISQQQIIQGEITNITLDVY